jgi:hypothetical protein
MRKNLLVLSHVCRKKSNQGKQSNSDARDRPSTMSEDGFQLTAWTRSRHGQNRIDKSEACIINLDIKHCNEMNEVL